MPNKTYWVAAHERRYPGEAEPQWILIHEQADGLSCLCGLRPMWWTGDLGKAKFMLKRQAKQYAASQFGELEWDKQNHVAVPGGRLWLVRP
jgi:hypothetical protein